LHAARKIKILKCVAATYENNSVNAYQFSKRIAKVQFDRPNDSSTL